MSKTANNNSLSIIHKLALTALIGLLHFVMLTAEPTLAQTGGTYDLTCSTIDGGGGTSSGGQYVVMGTIGQSDAAWSVGGDYELLGGFWPGEPLCTVDFCYFARFAEWWLELDCNELNDWCSGADLNYADGVDLVDLGLFVEEWLYYCPLDWPLK